MLLLNCLAVGVFLFSEHAEQRIVAQARKSSDFQRLVASGADVYLYTTLSPCAKTSPDCAGEIRKLTRDFDIERTLMVYDNDYDVEGSGLLQDSKDILNKARLDSNFDWVKTGKQRAQKLLFTHKIWTSVVSI